MLKTWNPCRLRYRDSLAFPAKTSTMTIWEVVVLDHWPVEAPRPSHHDLSQSCKGWLPWHLTTRCRIAATAMVILSSPNWRIFASNPSVLPARNNVSIRLLNLASLICPGWPQIANANALKEANCWALNAPICPSVKPIQKACGERMLSTQHMPPSPRLLLCKTQNQTNLKCQCTKQMLKEPGYCKSNPSMFGL